MGMCTSGQAVAITLVVRMAITFFTAAIGTGTPAFARSQGVTTYQVSTHGD